MAKEMTTKEVLVIAEKEIFDGKSTAVKYHFQTLIGKRDGIRARLANEVKKLETELEAIESSIDAFSKLSVNDAYLEAILPQTMNAQAYCGNAYTFSI